MKIVRLIALVGCSLVPALAQYQYDYPNILNPGISSQWWLNGWEGSTYIWVNTSGFGGYGSAVFMPALPTPSNGYEVNTTLPIYWWGDGYTILLRATPTAQAYGLAGANVGTTYAFVISVAAESSSPPATNCSVWLYKQISAAATQLSSGIFPCNDNNNMVVRAVVTQSNSILLYINGVLCMQVSDASIGTGQPGFTLLTGAIQYAEFGHQDTVPPIPINPASISASAQPDQVDLQWGATTDDPNGIGLLEYSVYRNGDPLATLPVTTTTFSDYTATPKTPYTYTIYAIDQHLNQVGTSINVTTPALSNVVPKTGVRPNGTYWGGGGEQIDMASGNLNYAVPILKAMGRGGWSVNFQLSYNSQNWRQDSGGVWQLGQDTGYGYGWRFQAGSITPVYSNAWNLAYYFFIDSTGAWHAFSINNGSNVWSSKDGMYLSYDATAKVLHFPDGSFWTFGSTSSTLEQDARTMYQP